MTRKLFSFLVAFPVLSIHAAQAQGDAIVQWFQITSGTYRECCGFGGARVSALPNDRQSFIKLSLDSSGAAGMSILGADRQTIYQIIPCPDGDPIPFQFEQGLVFSDRWIFHVDPGPPPYQVYWNYTVSNAATLRVDGELGMVQRFCADVPSRFSHSNVVATLVPSPPTISGVQLEGSELSFHVMTEPGYDYFVEYQEAWAATSWMSLTNFRVKLQAVDALITDSPLTGPSRFYRVRKEDCHCD
jgi:hypothetical protein